MKYTFITILLHVFMALSYSQELDKVQLVEIDKLSLDSIIAKAVHGSFNEKECNALAKLTAEYHIAKGEKRILTYLPAFPSSCTTCFYDKYGIQTYNVASSCEPSYATCFLGAYNDVMEAKYHIPSHHKLSSTIEFKEFEIAQSILITIDEKSDTNVLLKISVPYLDSLFGNEANFIRIRIKDWNDKSVIWQDEYLRLKNDGVIISTSIQQIQFSIDLSTIPDNYEICWCKSLAKEYRYVVKIKPQE